MHSARLLLSHGGVLWRVTLNEIRARYAGSLMGAGWLIVQPLVILVTYAVVYLYVFRVRVEGLSPVGYVLYLYAGLAPFLMTAEALSIGVTSVLSGRFVLESGGFPIDLVPAKAVLASQASMLVGFALVVAGGMVTGTLTWTVLMFPLIWALYVLGLIGLTWILSLVYLVFRDLPYVIGLALLMVMIASPIAYTPEMVPSGLRPLILANPFAYVVTASQQVLVVGRLPGPGSVAVLVGGSIGLFAVGGWFFSRAKGVLIDHA